MVMVMMVVIVVMMVVIVVMVVVIVVVMLMIVVVMVVIMGVGMNIVGLFFLGQRHGCYPLMPEITTPWVKIFWLKKKIRMGGMIITTDAAMMRWVLTA